MSIYYLSRDILKYISKFLDIKSLCRFSKTCKKIYKYLKIEKIQDINIISKNNSDCLDLTEFKIILPDIRMIKVSDYKELSKYKLPSTLNTIFVKNLEYLDIKYDLLNIENLFIENLYHNEDDYYDFTNLNKLISLHVEAAEEIILPNNLKNLYCDSINNENFVVCLDYLECNYLDVAASSFIDTIKIKSNYDGEFNIPRCNKLIINSLGNKTINYMHNKPAIIEYY